MKTIKNIINNIELLEEDFNTLNSRIIEFAKSTNKQDLDLDLLKHYIISFEKFKKLAIEYKNELNEIIGDNAKEEYKSQRKLMLFRLDKLVKLFDNNINKLDIIYNTFSTKKNKNKQGDFDFSSANEMLEINKNLYYFYNEHNKNLGFQKKYNIKISLDDKFENKIEKELKSRELVKSELKYLKQLNNIFEDIEILENEFYNFLDKLKNYKNIVNIYKKENFIKKTIEKTFKKEYVNENFNIKRAFIYDDFIKVKKIIIIENNFLETLTGLIKFKNKYKKFLNFDFFNIFGVDYFIDLLGLYNKIKISKTRKELKLAFREFGGIKYINKNLLFFENAGLFLSKFSRLYFKESKSYDFSTFDFFNSIMGIENYLLGEKFIKLGLENIKDNFINEIRNIKDIDKLNSILKKKNLLILDVETKVSKIKEVINKVSYKGTYKLRNSQKEIRQILLKLSNYFYIPNNGGLFKNLAKYLDTVISDNYYESKQSYEARQSSYSSSGSRSSSSSWSSGGGSFSSSYSSSGSSSW